MNRLETELQRLYPPQSEGQAGAMVLELARPASWHALAKVWQGVQADLELPAPAIAVSGGDGYQLWFAFDPPVPADQGLALLEALRARYLADVAPERITIEAPRNPPPVQVGPGRWSAFVAPDLAAVFADEPWLDLPPSPEAQAELLARVQAIAGDDVQRALQRLRPAEARPALAPAAPIDPGADPRGFLLAVMNDTTVDLQLRIAAAQALLPYFENRRLP